MMTLEEFLQKCPDMAPGEKYAWMEETATVVIAGLLDPGGRLDPSVRAGLAGLFAAEMVYIPALVDLVRGIPDLRGVELECAIEAAAVWLQGRPMLRQAFRQVAHVEPDSDRRGLLSDIVERAVRASERENLQA